MTLSYCLQHCGHHAGRSNTRAVGGMESKHRGSDTSCRIFIIIRDQDIAHKDKDRRK
jgi:hypothetical protein